jgi:hypothetical protein
MESRIKWQTASLFYSDTGKVAAVHNIKAYRRSRGIAHSFLNLCWMEVVMMPW